MSRPEPGPLFVTAVSRFIKTQRLFRYGGVSVVTAGLAQAALALGYGILAWPTTPAVALSLVASVIPAYWLNRRYVWGDRTTGRRHVATFFAMAVAGSAAAAVTTHVAEELARLATDDHRLLTAAVNATALATTVIVWLLRYVAFDRYVFVDRRHCAALRTQQ